MSDPEGSNENTRCDKDGRPSWKEASGEEAQKPLRKNSNNKQPEGLSDPEGNNETTKCRQGRSPKVEGEWAVKRHRNNIGAAWERVGQGKTTTSNPKG